MSKKIVIIGAGEIGLALGRILRAKEYSVKFWDKEPRVLESLGGEPANLPEVVPEADVLFLCVPSWALRQALLFATPYLSKHTVVVAVSKGIEGGSLKTMDEILKMVLSKTQSFALLSGPMLSEEIGESGFGAAVLATKSPKVGKLLTEIFAETNLSIEVSDDLRGVALSGVLKNIYAIALGMTTGLSLGENARGAVTVRALEEMKKIVSVLKGKQETVLGTAGLGDLVATGFSAYSKDHEAGISLVKGKEPAGYCEGLMSLPSVVNLLGEKYKKFLLLSSLSEVTRGELSPAEAFQKILFKK